MRGAVSILAGNQESNATQENGRGRKRRRMARPLKGMRSGRTQPSKRRSGKWKESAKTGRGTPKFCAPHNQNGTATVLLRCEKRRDINRNSGAPFKKVAPWETERMRRNRRGNAKMSIHRKGHSQVFFDIDKNDGAFKGTAYEVKNNPLKSTVDSTQAPAHRRTTERNGGCSMQMRSCKT